jgi:N-acetyl-gamma-glutamyl-phosphate reductase
VVEHVDHRPVEVLVAERRRRHEETALRRHVRDHAVIVPQARTLRWSSIIMHGVYDHAMSTRQRVAIVGAPVHRRGAPPTLRAASSFELVYATGDTRPAPAADLYPTCGGYPLCFEEFDPSRGPTGSTSVSSDCRTRGEHGRSHRNFVGSVGCVFVSPRSTRMKDASLYPEPGTGSSSISRSSWAEARCSGSRAVSAGALKGARLVATPGCHVTAAALALAPLTCRGLVEPTGIIVNSITGLSGAGRSLKQGAMFCSVDEDVQAYGLLDHRHTPEIEQVITPPGSPPCQVLFTPHLAPLNRGILATCYARPTGDTDTEQLLAAMSDQYHDEEFVVVGRTSPSTKATLGTNAAHVTARYRRAHEHRHLDLCDRQPLQGREWRRGAGRQRRARARGGCRAPEGRPLPVTGDHVGAATPVLATARLRAWRAALRTATLVVALLYIQRFRGRWSS